MWAGQLHVLNKLVHKRSTRKNPATGNPEISLKKWETFLSTLRVPKTLPLPPPPPLLNLDQPIVDELIMDIFLQLVIFLDENFPELKQVFEQHKVIYCKLFMTLMSWLK